MRSVHAAVLSAGACLLAVTVVWAQQSTPQPTRHPARQSRQGRPYDSQPLNLRKAQVGDEAAQLARTRMKNGDCAGALDAFDAALEESREPTLYRDRGLCHDKLGHPYPAIDDYRAYLTAVPDAADADDIRGRLDRLLDETSGRPPRPNDDTDVPSAREDAPDAAAAAAPAADRDQLEYVEADEESLHTPLRAGRGWSVAPLLSMRGWLGSSTPAGAESTSAECIGLQVRYAATVHGALVLEAGYEPFNLTESDAQTVSGLTSQVGYELRLPLDAAYDNQILLTPGLGYEHLSVSPTNAQLTPFFLGAFVPRLRLGFRHLLATNTAVDFSIDGGVANFFQYRSFPYESDQSLTIFVAGQISVAWGL